MTVVAAFDVDGTVTTATASCRSFGVSPARPRWRARLGRSIHRLVPAAGASRPRRVEGGGDASGVHRTTDRRRRGGRRVVRRAHRPRHAATRRRRAHPLAPGGRVIASCSCRRPTRCICGRSPTAWGSTAWWRPSSRSMLAGGAPAPSSSGNCRGPVKARRLLAWLDANHGGRDAVELWAYGDSPGDRELLAAADRPVWVVRTSDPLRRRRRRPLAAARAGAHGATEAVDEERPRVRRARRRRRARQHQ